MWIWTGATLALVALCVALSLSPFAAPVLGGVGARVWGGALNRRAQTFLCPAAKPSDAAPKDPKGQFTIQPVYAETLTYATDAAAQPKSQRVHLWSVDVLGQYPPMDDIFTEAVGGVDQWNTTLSATDPAAFRCVVQDMQAGNVAGQALTVLRQAALILPGPATTAYLVPWNTTKFGGASGTQSLLIPYWEPNPLDRSLSRAGNASWSDVAFALDHEYLEVTRYDRLGSMGNAYQTLLDNMVTDGLADEFAAHMTNVQPDYGISTEQEASLWAQFKPTLTQYANPNETQQMLGDPAQGIPNAAGYQIGDHIVAMYLQKHPGASWTQLAGMDGQTVFAGSGYNGVFAG